MEPTERGAATRREGVGFVLFRLVTIITIAAFAYVALLSVCYTDLFYPNPLVEVTELAEAVRHRSPIPSESLASAAALL